MFKWLGDAISSVGSFLGDGAASLLSWLFSGLISVLTKVVRAGEGLWDVVEAIFGFFLSVIDAITGLIPAVFPFVPEEVAAVITAGLFAVLIAGIIKRKKG